MIPVAVFAAEFHLPPRYPFGDNICVRRGKVARLRIANVRPRCAAAAACPNLPISLRRIGIGDRPFPVGIAGHHRSHGWRRWRRGRVRVQQTRLHIHVQLRRLIRILLRDGEQIQKQFPLQRRARRVLRILGRRFGVARSFAGRIDRIPAGDQSRGLRHHVRRQIRLLVRQRRDQRLQLARQLVVMRLEQSIPAQRKELRQLRGTLPVFRNQDRVNFADGRPQRGAERILGLLGSLAQTQLVQVGAKGRVHRRQRRARGRDARRKQISRALGRHLADIV